MKHPKVLHEEPKKKKLIIKFRAEKYLHGVGRLSLLEKRLDKEFSHPLCCKNTKKAIALKTGIPIK
jgi:hypothetical protein